MNTIIKGFIFSIFLSLAIVSCDTSSKKLTEDDRNTAFKEWSDTIIKSKYDDGSIRLVYGYKANDNEMHYEWQYYRNGNLWLEGPMYDTLRHGIWKGYEEKGALIAQGTYKVGKESGIYTVWYSNGIKFYEGNMIEGDRVGEWSFYDKEANLIKTIDYSICK